MKKRIILNTSDTAEMMSVTRQAFNRWKVKPHEKKNNQTFYDLKEVIAFKAGRPSSTTSELTDVRVEILRTQSEKKKLDLEIQRGEYVQNKIYESDIDKLFSIIKTQVLSLPSKLAPIIQNVKTREAFKILTKECESVLSQAADNIETAQKNQRK